MRAGYDKYPLKGQCHDIQWFLRFFCASRKMATARASVADIRPWQLDQLREELHRPRRVEQKSLSSRKCRFPRCSLVAAIIFPTQNGCQNHRLSWHCRFKGLGRSLVVCVHLDGILIFFFSCSTCQRHHWSSKRPNSGGGHQWKQHILVDLPWFLCPSYLGYCELVCSADEWNKIVIQPDG